MPTSSLALLTCERRAVAVDCQRVVATGEVDIATQPLLVAALLAAQADARHVVLDLNGTTFMDGGGSRVLRATAEHARATTGTFDVVHVTAPVMRVLALTGVDRALASVRSRRASPQRRERATARGPHPPLPARNRPSPLPSPSAPTHAE